MVRKSSIEKSAAMNMERLRMLKRNQCLKKKTMELSTLCGIDAMIICLSNDGEITDTWPEKNPQIESVITRYRNYMISQKQRGKVIKVKKLSSSSENTNFDMSSLEGEGGDVSVSEKELREYEMELEKIIQNPSFDERLEEGFSGKELNEFDEMELEKKKKNNNRGGGGECIDSSLVPWVSSFSSSSSPATELDDEDPSMVLNFDTMMMSTKFAEKNPSFASCSSDQFLVEEEKERFLWDYQNLDSEFLMGGDFNASSSSSWSLSPSLPPDDDAAAVASYCSNEFSVEGDFDDTTALPTMEEVLSHYNITATVAADDHMS